MKLIITLSQYRALVFNAFLVLNMCSVRPLLEVLLDPVGPVLEVLLDSLAVILKQSEIQPVRSC